VESAITPDISYKTRSPDISKFCKKTKSLVRQSNLHFNIQTRCFPTEYGKKFGNLQPEPMNFQENASFYGLYNMESLINKSTTIYTCFYNLFNVRWLETTKDEYFKEGVV